MSKITLIDLVNLENQTTAVNAINTNNAVIEAFSNDVLSLDGTAPNQMGSILDMNSNRIINLPEPVGNTEPLRLQDLADFNAGGTINVNSPPPSTTLPIADSPIGAIGTSTNYARADHSHPEEIIAAVLLPQNLGPAAVGTSVKYAREDHVHNLAAVTPSPGDNDTSVATTAFVQQAIAFPINALHYGNNVNTIVQTAAAGVGGNNSNSENVAFYDNDGDFVIGPGSRSDITILMNSPLNMFKRHNHVQFNQAPVSSTRPVSSMLFTPTGAGTVTNVKNSFGGICQISCGTSAAGDGGILTMDYSPQQITAGCRLYSLMYASQNTNQVINFGWTLDSNNAVYLSRSDLSTQGNWVAHCISGGTATAQGISPSLNNSTNRTIFCIDYDGSTMTFWVGNFNDTLVQAAQITTNIPTSSAMLPFVQINSQGAASNATLNITDFYNIKNA